MSSEVTIIIADAMLTKNGKAVVEATILVGNAVVRKLGVVI
jgi:hypothetical protein